jgi:hypothetical protein
VRYYKIIITDPGLGTTGNVIYPFGGSPDPTATFTSYANGRTLPGALNVEFDLPVGTFDYAGGQGDAAGAVQVHGVSLRDINQARDLTGKSFQIWGGMQKGLPLANPAQIGLLMTGYVHQAFGNWVDTEQTLDLVIRAGQGPNGTGTQAQPRNIVVNWLAGQTLGLAIKNALLTAFPGYVVTDNTSPRLIARAPQTAFYQTVGQMATWAKQASASVITDPGYLGIGITQPTQTSYSLFDGSQQTVSPKTIDFRDLIGQPTWIESPFIQFKCPVRADIAVGDLVIMPPVIATETASPSTQPIDRRAAFQGTFRVQSVRHVGNYRQPDAASWVTNFTAAPTSVTSLPGSTP